MTKDELLSALRREIEDAKRRLAASEGTEDGLERVTTDEEAYARADQGRYLAELEADLAITEETLSEADLRAADEAMALERHGEGLAVVVGHTKNAPGARGVAPPLPTSPSDARHEYAWNTELAYMIKRKADAIGLRCEVFFRDRGGITGAYARVRQWRPAATLELHFNAFNERARGTETLFASSGSRAWAQALQDEFVTLYGREGSLDRGLKDRSGGGRGKLSLIRISPSALIEPFFGDELADAELGERHKETLADAVVAAFGMLGSRNLS